MQFHGLDELIDFYDSPTSFLLIWFMVQNIRRIEAGAMVPPTQAVFLWEKPEIIEICLEK